MDRNGQEICEEGGVRGGNRLLLHHFFEMKQLIYFPDCEKIDD